MQSGWWPAWFVHHLQTDLLQAPFVGGWRQLRRDLRVGLYVEHLCQQRRLMGKLRIDCAKRVADLEPLLGGCLIRLDASAGRIASAPVRGTGVICPWGKNLYRDGMGRVDLFQEFSRQARFANPSFADQADHLTGTPRCALPPTGAKKRHLLVAVEKCRAAPGQCHFQS